jgi:hypothetical protein
MQTSNTVEREQHETPAPKPKVSRQHRRASMRDMNNKLLREREIFRQEYIKLQRGHRAMSLFLSDIAKTVGIIVPTTPTQSVNAADLVRDRIIALVELEKRVKEKEERENPMFVMTGYQPTDGGLDQSNPPTGGSGVVQPGGAA